MNRNRMKQIRPTLIWLGLFVMFFNMANFFQPAKYAVLSAISDTATLYLVVLITTKFLFPKFYGKQAYYFLYATICILLISLVFFLINMYLPRVEHDTHEKPPYVFHFIRIVFSSAFAFSIATALKLMEHTNALRENEKLLIEEKLVTELKLLKAQINPHFIFNALNNIYSLTYMKSKNAPESVLKLSEMLRYVFYECAKDRVNLSSEIKYIENFTAFQQMKSDYAQNISLQVDSEIGAFEIAPMLFIPFIENAFKYSRIEEDENAWVSIVIKKKENKLNFRIENSVKKANKPLSGSGMGIKNVKHRLNILYSEMHKIEIEELSDTFIVDLWVAI